MKELEDDGQLNSVVSPVDPPAADIVVVTESVAQTDCVRYAYCFGHCLCFYFIDTEVSRSIDSH